MPAESPTAREPGRDARFRPSNRWLAAQGTPKAAAGGPDAAWAQIATLGKSSATRE